MAKEIERRFIVIAEDWRAAVVEQNLMRQGFLLATQDKVVRVRIQNEQAWLTVKIAQTAAERLEFEYDIPKSEAAEILDTCPAVIEKTRYVVRAEDGKTWEVDIYHGEHEGLRLAEIELASADEAFILPPWLGKEVTDNGRYTNAQLSQCAFKNWPPEDKKDHVF